jgi:hypothetical protein
MQVIDNETAECADLIGRIRKSGTIAVIMPAENADRIPLNETSNARQNRGSTPSRSAATT